LLINGVGRPMRNEKAIPVTIIWPLFFLLIYVTINQSQSETIQQAELEKQKATLMQSRMIAASQSQNETH
jgi:hypothetical protein